MESHSRRSTAAIVVTVLMTAPSTMATAGTTATVGLLTGALRFEDGLSRGKRGRLLAAFEREAATLYPDPTLGALNVHFFGQTGFAAIPDASAPEGSSVAATLQSRRSTCVGLAIVYLAFAERVGLEARAVATPVHLFIRVRLPDGIRNVELMEGGIHLDDDIYRRRYRIDPAAIEAGVFMQDLTTDEVLAHLLSNQGVALSRQGKPRAALRRYRKALDLAPDLVAAWYNQGIDLMKQGHLKKALASFDRAIAIYPADGPARNNRGLVRAQLGDIEGARADFERALQLEPGMREAEENLKRLLAR